MVLVPRDVPLEPKRVMSVFRERVEKHKDELAELQEQEKLIEKEKPVSSFSNPPKKILTILLSTIRCMSLKK